MLDSNIIIYASTGEISIDNFLTNSTSFSIITKIEVLGYPNLGDKEKEYFKTFFKALRIVEVNSDISEKAISLRQNNKIKLADAIIAASAIEKNMILVTRNVKDFKLLKELKLVNPFDEKYALR